MRWPTDKKDLLKTCVSVGVGFTFVVKLVESGQDGTNCFEGK